MADFTLPDYDPDVTFNAVGRAISAWETLEAHLSYLYSIFIGKPMLIDALEAYGRENKIFEQRIRGLCGTAEAYFMKQPSQDREGEVDAIISEARRLSIYRHQIAHGIITAIMVAEVANNDQEVEDLFQRGPKFCYCVVPPWYGAIHLTKETRVLPSWLSGHF
jgi:hypothetical protein